MGWYRLSGVVCMQAVIYARLFENDSSVLKLVVSTTMSMPSPSSLTYRPGRACLVSGSHWFR